MMARRSSIPSKCPKCDKPVYFAERKTSLGHDWHPTCLRCENCNKILQPGSHSEHCRKPFCNNCYKFLYGPEGTKLLESKEEQQEFNLSPELMARSQDVLSKVKEYNISKENARERIKCREVDGDLMLEGMISLYWGLKNPIVLAPGAIYAKQKMQYRDSVYEFIRSEDATYLQILDQATKRRDLSDVEVKWLKDITDSIKENPVAEEGEEAGGPRGAENPRRDAELMDNAVKMDTIKRGQLLDQYKSLDPKDFESGLDASSSSNGGEVVRRTLGSMRPRSNTQVRKRSASFRKVSKQKKMEESKLNERQTFTPPHGTPTNLRVTNTMSSNEVIGMLLQKYNVENSPSDFALCVRRDTGVMEPFREEDVPLMVRLRLGPSEDIAKIFVLEASEARLLEVTEETANWMKFSEAELNIFIKKFNEEEEKETKKIVERFKPWRTAIRQEQENIKQNGNGHRKSRTGSWIETDV
ncbi:hypothetical protein EMCRGX_G006978 [Ephydatia muelleri]